MMDGRGFAGMGRLGRVWRWNGGFVQFTAVAPSALPASLLLFSMTTQKLHAVEPIARRRSQSTYGFLSKTFGGWQRCVPSRLRPHLQSPVVIHLPSRRGSLFEGNSPIVLHGPQYLQQELQITPRRPHVVIRI